MRHISRAGTLSDDAKRASQLRHGEETGNVNPVCRQPTLITREVGSPAERRIDVPPDVVDVCAEDEAGCWVSSSSRSPDASGAANGKISCAKCDVARDDASFGRTAAVLIIVCHVVM